MITLGSKVKDIYTGFTGVAVSRTDWLYGCSRIAIQSCVLKDGKTIEPEWFDEQRVELVVDRLPEVSKDSAARIGGPQRDPSRGRDPR